MAQRTTLKELSKLLDLSVSTVSKALNDSSEISTSTRTRVKELAASKHYVPNSLARNLKLQKTQTIGVILPSLSSKFYISILEGIEVKARQLGYHVIICNSNETMAVEIESINSLIHGHVDGLLIFPTCQTKTQVNLKHFKTLFDYKIPFVLLDKTEDNISSGTTLLKDTLKLEWTLGKLISLGSKNICYLTETIDTEKEGHLKEQFMSCLEGKNRTASVLEYSKSNFPIKKLMEWISSNKIDGLFIHDTISYKIFKHLLKYEDYEIFKEIPVICHELMPRPFSYKYFNDRSIQLQGEIAVEAIKKRIDHFYDTFDQKSAFNKTPVLSNYSI